MGLWGSIESKRNLRTVLVNGKECSGTQSFKEKGRLNDGIE